LVPSAGFHIIETGDGKAAVIFACARTQERQQVQITHAQFLQIRDARTPASVPPKFCT
jgi:hypothetical protein